MSDRIYLDINTNVRMGSVDKITGNWHNAYSLKGLSDSAYESVAFLGRFEDTFFALHPYHLIQQPFQLYVGKPNDLKHAIVDDFRSEIIRGYAHVSLGFKLNKDDRVSTFRMEFDTNDPKKSHMTIDREPLYRGAVDQLEVLVLNGKEVKPLLRTRTIMI